MPDNDFLSAELYNQVFTVHGSVMMFLFAIPIFEAIAVIFLPQMLGARDLPFPRLSAFGFWCFLLGGIFLCGSIFFNAAPSGGWFMYPPLTSIVSARDRSRHLAVGLFVHRGGGDCGCRGNDRRHAQMPSARDANQSHPALCLVRIGCSGDDPLRFPAAHRRQHALRTRACIRLAILQPSTGRRSAFVATPVLALRSSGGLYHFFAVSGFDRDDRADVRAQTHRRL